jgi:hypothetical protein
MQHFNNGGTKMKKLMLSSLAGIFFLVTAGSAAAAVTFIPPFDGQHKTLTGNEAYYSGGVGITERTQMKDMTKGFNLKLIFDTKTGAYLSSVAVKIEDAKGTVLINTVSKGPWFSAKLPAANYRITASFDNHEYVRNIKLTQKPQVFILSWTA